MLQRMKSQRGTNNALEERALVELRSRLSRWWGHDRVPTDCFLGTSPKALNGTIVVPADPVELLIVRAISTSSEMAQFGVAPAGAVFTTDANEWTAQSRCVFVGGLSPVLDQATEVVNRGRPGTEGRFFERGGRFLDANGTTFFEVQSSGVKGVLQHLASSFSTLFSNTDASGLTDRDVHSHMPPTAPWSPSPPPARRLVVTFKTPDLPNPGVLSQMGYHVGKNGLSATARRAILKEVLAVQLVAPSADSEGYIAEWGPPRSGQRLGKMRNALRGFVNYAQRRDADMSESIADWLSDLEWIDVTYGG
jgi:hypothetical protein